MLELYWTAPDILISGLRRGKKYFETLQSDYAKSHLNKCEQQQTHFSCHYMNGPAVGITFGVKCPQLLAGGSWPPPALPQPGLADCKFNGIKLTMNIFRFTDSPEPGSKGRAKRNRTSMTPSD